MRTGPGSEQRRPVAVGPDRVVAAQVFGAIFDHAHVTSYEDFHTEVDLATIDSVGLVDTSETAGFVDELLRALAADTVLRPAKVTRTDGKLLIALRPAAEVGDADLQRVRTALRPTETAERGLLSRLASRLRA